jgi:hypothetical protein
VGRGGLPAPGADAVLVAPARRGQHFAVNHVRHTPSPVDPWNECPRVLRSVFGDVDTVGGAILLNEALRGHPRFLHDAQLRALETSPEAFGFTRVPLAAPGEVLLVRASGRLGWSRAKLERH